MLKWQPIQPFGAYVDADLSNPMSEADQAELRNLLWDHGVLVFKNQALSHERQADIVDIFDVVPRDSEGMHFVSTEQAKGGLGRGELTFHSDCSFMSEPRTVLSLHALDVVPGETSTQWTSAREAWKAMPVELQSKLTDAKALQVLPDPQFTDRLSTDILPEWLPHHWHDALIAHPHTGERLPYIMAMQTTRIEGLSPADSNALIEQVLDIMYRKEAIYEHVWHNGDVVIWDNVATQHARGSLVGKGKRILQKVQAGGESLYKWKHFRSPELQAVLTREFNS